MACYPIEPNDDGTATCYRCHGEGRIGPADRSAVCPACHDAGFLTAAEVARYVRDAAEAEAERARWATRAAAARAARPEPPLAGSAAEEPF